MSYSPGYKQEHRVNLGDNQRILSAVGGSLLLYFVAKKHTINSLLLLGGGYLLYRAISGHCPVTASVKRNSRKLGNNINIRGSAVVNRPVSEIYAFWRDSRNIPKMLRHIGRIEVADDGTAIWGMDLPDIGEVSWRTRILRERQDRELSWHSMEGAAIEQMGKVNFSPTPGGGTRVEVVLSYRAPAGPIDERLERLLTPAFRQKIEEEIRQMPEFFEQLSPANG